MATINTGLFQFLGFQSQGDLGGYTMYTAKDRGLVFFPKTPPLKPPSVRQKNQRERWRIAASEWQKLTKQQKHAWLEAANKARLSIHGYNLFLYWQTTRDHATIQTIENQSKINLL